MGVSRPVRAARWAGVALVALAPLPLLAVAASADTTSVASSSTSGSGGSLSIHDEGTPAGTPGDDLLTCVFDVEGFSFETGQTGFVLIEPQGSDGQGSSGGDSPVGPLEWGPADGSGFAATDYINSGSGFRAVNGEYQAVLYRKMLPTGELTDVVATSSVFTVDCGADNTPSPKPTKSSHSPRPTTTSASVTPTTTSGSVTPTTTSGSVTPTSTSPSFTEGSSSAPGTTSAPGPTKTSKQPTVLPTRSSQPAVLPQTGAGFPTAPALAASLLLIVVGGVLILGPGRAVPASRHRRH
jgi:hypothetical protein